MQIQWVKRLLWVCLLSAFYSNVSAQNASNKGKDFWLGYGSHVRGYDNGTQRMILYITSDVNTTGKIQVQDSIASFAVTANSITQVEVPQSAFLDSWGLSDKGIHVTAEKPVVVYAHIYNENVSGATLVLPVNTLGKDYYSLNYEQVSNEPNAFSYFFIVAVEDNTQVEITPTAGNQNKLPVGKPKIISLNKGQVYQVLGDSTEKVQIGKDQNDRPVYKYLGTDLTGTRIRSVSTTNEVCKRIAVFSGSGKIAIGCGPGLNNSGSADNLFQQVYPTAAWGRTFVTVPLKSRNYDIYRIVKSSPDAVVTLNGSPVTFTNDLYYEFKSQQVNYIQADKPIQVIQYAVTQSKGLNCVDVAETAGDPEMIFLNPLEQTLNKITMYSTSLYKIINHFINVVIPTQAVATFRLDGADVSAQFKPLQDKPDYSYAQLSVREGVHTLSASEGFNAIAYGFGQYESYGYAAGANLVAKGIEAEDIASNKIATSGCVGISYRLKISLPFEAVKLKLDMGDGRPAADVPINLLSSYQENNTTIYVYDLATNISSDTAKTYHIKVLADKSQSDGCGSTEEFDMDFDVYQLPTTSFSADKQLICLGTTVKFTDTSNPNGMPISKWLWDFGDPASGADNTSTLQNPSHTYTAPGDYPVNLVTEGATGCTSLAIQPLMIHVAKIPKAAFSYPDKACERQPGLFTDQSSPEEGTIQKWLWDFGDGTTEERASGEPFTYTYVNSGTYTVTLKVQTDKGCQSDVYTATIVVRPSPVVDFSLPDACSSDVATFGNLTTISDHSELNYLWDFGDPASGAANTSPTKDASHLYTSSGTYTLKLTVTSKYGCSVSVEKQFQINGDKIKPDFEIAGDMLCSNEAVSFINKSTVDFGKITKIELYFDADNPADKLEIPNPQPDQVFTHFYPNVHTVTPKEYRVKMKAYSGTLCSSETDWRVIKVKGVPEIKLKPVSVCEDAEPFQPEVTERYGFTAASKAFTIDDKASDGLFNPGKVGLGKHKVTCTFTATNGCSAKDSTWITVDSVPVVQTEKTAYILAGGEVQLKTEATGSGLKYQWSPAAGLSSDNAAQPIASPNQDTEYTVTVTSDAGCVASDRVLVKVIDRPVIPNAFSPNGDGVNDTWAIKYLDTWTHATIQIYNRYGQQVFQSGQYNTPWDGRFKNQDVPVGVYYYVIEPNNGQKRCVGSVTLLR
ncbi:PKD domain-containing protein [Pedobacter sp. BS3]|uniref:PKD domain-containing protein n=1 Tax=Pedobacter sp. BS3 TaxID=2567937 RepID=UPI001659F370|nr:PKD domain-containing protein [Pedobacter sp. BS3]